MVSTEFRTGFFSCTRVELYVIELSLFFLHTACKKAEWWGACMVICLERGADLHMAQLMPLSLTVSCFSKIQINFTFLVPADPGSPGQRAVKQVWGCQTQFVF